MNRLQHLSIRAWCARPSTWFARFLAYIKGMTT